MEFRLVFKGRLPAESNRPRTEDKHRIRKLFHRQLKELWQRDPCLKRQLYEPVHVLHNAPNKVVDPGKKEIHRATPLLPGGRPWVEHVADDYARCGFRFVPIAREENGLTYALDILFLRRGHPGDMFDNHGDIDNRIKVLFDSFSLSLATWNASLPMAYRLYLPEEWAKDSKRRNKTGVPKEIPFQTKPQIALEQIRLAVKADVPRGVVLADAGYGLDTQFRTAISELKLEYVMGVQSSMTVWEPDREPLPAKPWKGQG